MEKGIPKSTNTQTNNVFQIQNVQNTMQVESGNQECNSGAGARKFPEACEGALYGSELTHDASKVIDQSTTPPSSSSALRAPSLKNFSDNFLDYFCLTCIISGANGGRSCREQSQVNCETSISLVENGPKAKCGRDNWCFLYV